MLSLAEKAEYAFFDGTFKASPSGYTQLLVLMVLNTETNTYTPIMYFFATSKQQELYEYIFLTMKMVFEKYQVKINWKGISMDFEKGLQNAWSKYFQIKIIGCFFHLVN